MTAEASIRERVVKQRWAAPGSGHDRIVRWTKIALPSGRAAKPTANVAKDASVPAVGSASGKKTSGNTSAAAVPYRK